MPNIQDDALWSNAPDGRGRGFRIDMQQAMQWLPESVCRDCRQTPGSTQRSASQKYSELFLGTRTTSGQWLDKGGSLHLSGVS